VAQAVMGTRASAAASTSAASTSAAATSAWPGTDVRLRALGGVRAALGATWLVALAADKAAAGAALPRAGRLAALALAVRDLAQGALLVARPRRGSAEAGAVVDVLHGMSMLPVIAFVPRYRTAAAVSATTAAGWVGLAALTLHDGSGHRDQRAGT
jgi:hypothetical protein